MVKPTGHKTTTTGSRRVATAMTMVFASLALITPVRRSVEATVTCTDTSECESLLRPGSECTPQGVCTNPFHKGGCLANMMDDRSVRANIGGIKSRLRVCTSHDPLSSAELGYCRQPDTHLLYMEARIHGQNWESSVFETWILQVLLSEVLGVPASVETGVPEMSLDFYDTYNALDFGISGTEDWESLHRAAEYVDCRLVGGNNGEGENAKKSYQSCAHVIPEVWYSQLSSYDSESRRRSFREGVIDPAQALGVYGKNSWFIPRFTAERDPTLLTYMGMRGEENRRKLAETFPRPTTWGDYCEQVSVDKCSTDDGVASRPPADDLESVKLFAGENYKGHFRFTDKNNCTKNPSTCTGHIADYPCGWTSFVIPITHHLNIALESDGDGPSGEYTYQQLMEMWLAANHTQSNFIGLWWTPEALYESFLGTESEFQQVTLPPPTFQCYENRVNPTQRCDMNESERLGDTRGVCDEAPLALQKIVSRGLYWGSQSPEAPEALWSPAYQAVKLFSMSVMQLGKIFEYWLRRGVDMNGYDAREATCRWIVENFDFVKEFIPRTYPRIVLEGNVNEDLYIASVVVSVLATLLVVFACWMTYMKRGSRPIKFAQIQFLWLLLIGLLLLSLGAVVNAIPPTDAACVAVIWLVNLGYTLELVPLIIKVAALNKLLGASNGFRRATIKRRSLLRKVFFIAGLVVLYLTLWTAIDAPRKGAEYKLTDSVTDDGETVVTVGYYCESKTNIWWYISIGWNVLLLIWATVLAIQTRKIRQDFNESQALGFMIYAHFFFVVVRVITVFVGDAMASSDMARVRSLIYCADATTTILVYFFPKFFGRMDNSATRTNAAPLFSGPSSLEIFVRLHDSAPGSTFTYACPVHSLEAASRFYEEVVGCKKGRASPQWQEYALHGHHIVCRWVGSEYQCSDVLPVPHMGLVVTTQQFHELADRVRNAAIDFVIEPHLQFADQPKEQWVMLFRDPSGNNLVFKTLKKTESHFAADDDVDINADKQETPRMKAA